MRLLLRILINAAALWVATQIVPGVRHTGPWVSLLLVALVFGLLHALVRPMLKLLTCLLILLTLGLFTFVINAIVLWLTSASSESLDLCFHVAIACEVRKRGVGKAGGINHFGFRLVDPKDIDKAVKNAVAAGGKLLRRGDFAPGVPYAFVADPDGYEVEIWY